ncbi:MAG TPA: hypothetical protein VI248_21025 [Kineosporiaceae bacterium]
MSTEPLGGHGRAEEQTGPPLPEAAPRPAPPGRPPQRGAPPPSRETPRPPADSSAGSPPSVAAGEPGQWAQLSAQFVDDPPAAVKAAAVLVEEAVQRVLRHPDGDTDTEVLRAAFVRYRDLYRTLSGGRQSG